MSRRLHELLPDPEVVLAMEPEELGIYVLQTLKGRSENRGQIILNNEIGPLADGYPPSVQDRIRDVIAEAWAWLESQNLLVPAWKSGGTPAWRVLSRRARELSTGKQFAALRLANALPRESLHPAIPDQVRINFLKGDLDTAVSQAMKQVEIAIRDATPFKEETSGVRLARKAFHVDTGPLTDPDAEGGERQAMGDLVAGALGVLKNPHSHRNVQLTDPADAAAAILLASYLLRVVSYQSLR